LEALNAAGEPAATERCVGDERDAELAQCGQRGLGLGAIEQRELALQRADRVNQVRATNGRRRRFAEPEVADLPLLDQPLHGADRLLDRHARIDPVLIVEVDDVHAEPFEAQIAGLGDVLGPAVDDRAPLGRPRLSELGGEHHLVPASANGPAQQLLVVAEAVHVRRVEEVHAPVQRVLNDPDRLRVVALAVRAGHGHAAQADRRHRERAVTESTVFHGPPLRYRGILLLLSRTTSWPPAEGWWRGLLQYCHAPLYWNVHAAVGRSADCAPRRPARVSVSERAEPGPP